MKNYHLPLRFYTKINNDLDETKNENNVEKLKIEMEISPKYASNLGTSEEIILLTDSNFQPYFSSTTSRVDQNGMQIFEHLSQHEILQKLKEKSKSNINKNDQENLISNIAHSQKFHWKLILKDGNQLCIDLKINDQDPTQETEDTACLNNLSLSKFGKYQISIEIYLNSPTIFIYAKNPKSDMPDEQFVSFSSLETPNWLKSYLVFNQGESHSFGFDYRHIFLLIYYFFIHFFHLISFYLSELPASSHVRKLVSVELLSLLIKQRLIM